MIGDRGKGYGYYILLCIPMVRCSVGGTSPTERRLVFPHHSIGKTGRIVDTEVHTKIRIDDTTYTFGEHRTSARRPTGKVCLFFEILCDRTDGYPAFYSCTGWIRIILLDR